LSAADKQLMNDIHSLGLMVMNEVCK